MRAIVPVIAGAAVLAVGGGSLAFAGLRSDVSLAVDGGLDRVVESGQGRRGIGIPASTSRARPESSRNR